MGANTAIEWADHTFNPWRGCVHVSPGCANCYAETLARRFPGTLGTWGASGARVPAAESKWREPERWERHARKWGVRPRVFCASLADVFEPRPDLARHRRRLFALIAATPHLDWLILTKRPDVARVMLSDGSLRSVATQGPSDPWPLPNVWLGTSVEDQRRADERVPVLLDTPAAVRFLSCEPLLGPVDVSEHLSTTYADGNTRAVDWLIVGGESGPNARATDLAWIRSLVEQAQSAGVPVFVKQVGAMTVDSSLTGIADADRRARAGARDPKGGDPDAWPADLRVREFPAADTFGVLTKGGAS